MQAIPKDPNTLLRQNALLATLSEAARERILPAMEIVSLPLGQVLYESGERQDHVYFPMTSIVSLLHMMENGASAEIAVTGYYHGDDIVKP